MRFSYLLLMLSFAPLTLGRAEAGIVEDLVEVAGENIPEADRMTRFNALVATAGSNNAQISSVAMDETQDNRVRWIAIRVMGQSQESSFIETIEGLCDDESPVIRIAALSGLADLTPTTATNRVSLALQDPAIVVRGAAADTLAILRDIRAIDELERALGDSSNWYRGQSLWVRPRIVLALGATRSPMALPALSRALGDDDSDVVDAALQALRTINGFDFAEGRSRDEHIQAWQRWIPANL